MTPTFTPKPPGEAPSTGPLLPQLSGPQRPRQHMAPGPIPASEAAQLGRAPTEAMPPLQGEAEELALEQVTLPAFINEVFSKALHLTVRVDQRVASRTDLVTLRTGKPLTATELFAMSTKVLDSYGIAASWDGHVLNIVPDETLLAQMPEIIRSRALPELPAAMRPIFQVIDLNHVGPADLASTLSSVYGQKVKVFPAPKSNSILLFGLPEDVRAAVEAVQVLDQPRLAGRESLRISPIYWTAAKLADQLVTVLKAEGYDASSSPSSQAAAIMVVPIEANNSVIVFASDSKILDHVKQWVNAFDQPANADPNNNIFVYQVQNTTAASLGDTVIGVLGGSTQGAGGRGAGAGGPEAKLEQAGQTRNQPGGQNQPQAGGGAAQQGTSVATVQGGGRLITDTQRNALIFVGTAQDYERIRPLLLKLDVPPLEVLIEATVVELDLSDTTNLGIEWSILNHIGGGYTQSLGTSGNVITSGGGAGGGFGLPSGGFNYTILNGVGQVRFALNALAQHNPINVLSTPRILAKSGAQASIQVGSQVPIVTSQATSSQVALAGNSGILQSIEYQQTGVLLTVSPVVHSGNRVDLTINQTVSAALPNTTSGISSPVIQNRDVKTDLTLGDGQTVVIGGMIQETRNDNSQGVPYLEDIPLLGLAFKSQSVVRQKTELLVFITPYVVSNDVDAQAITKQFQNQMQRWPLPPTTLQW